MDYLVFICILMPLISIALNVGLSYIEGELVDIKNRFIKGNGTLISIGLFLVRLINVIFLAIMVLCIYVGAILFCIIQVID